MGAPEYDAERVDTVKPIECLTRAVKTDDRLLRGRNGRLALVNRKSELPLYGLLEEDSIDNTTADRLSLPPTYAIESLILARVQMEIEKFVRFVKRIKTVALSRWRCRCNSAKR